MKIFILVCGAVLIAAVIVHGLWVVRRSRRNPLKMDLVENENSKEFDEMELLRGELPNGGARIAVNQARTPVQATMALQKEDDLIENSELATEKRAALIEEVHDSSVVANESPIVAEAILSRPRRTGKGGQQESEKTSKVLEENAAFELENPTDLVIVSVMDSDGQFWIGSKVLEVLLRHGLKYGDMNIFHRVDTAGDTQFSVA
ncbi:MAG: cell division protein ZipA C-terminal FtsZ-binding domain-containing protein, partial [Pseudomonadota bacterium]|nr:cell division protein ZipA C-terminal FtsZ-binding domain-containing protein [Pseudomonadota bacterium]